MRRATKRDFWRRYNLYNFNPRSPWGERLFGLNIKCKIKDISIHALREESDFICLRVLLQSAVFQSTLSVRRATLMRTEGEYIISIFQSTLSVRRATAAVILWYIVTAISIHALREESDPPPWYYDISWRQFQSTLSVRRATQKQHKIYLSKKFQSTLSVRRATSILELVC